MATASGISFGASQRSEVIFPFAVMVMIAVLIVPLPTVMIDVLLTLNMGIVLLLLLVTLGVRQPLELSVFPSAILLLTLARLPLNVARAQEVEPHHDLLQAKVDSAPG